MWKYFFNVFIQRIIVLLLPTYHREGTKPTYNLYTCVSLPSILLHSIHLQPPTGTTLLYNTPLLPFYFIFQSLIAPKLKVNSHMDLNSTSSLHSILPTLLHRCFIPAHPVLLLPTTIVRKVLRHIVYTYIFQPPLWSSITSKEEPLSI